MSSPKMLWLLPLLLLAACNSNKFDSDKTAAAPAADSSQASVSSNITTGTPLNSPERKIIHTADIHCRVQNVFAATAKLENLVKSVGGIVQESHIDNSGYDTKTSYYKPDSLKQTQTYTTTATLILRVPSACIDSVVNAVPGIATFIDSRTLRQSDVTYKYLGNKLKIEADNSAATAATAMQLARKSKDAIAIAVYEESKKYQKAERQTENLYLADDVNYATVTIALSQPEMVFVQTITNPDYFTKVPFTVECRNAMSNGWNFITSFVVALISIWPLLLMIIPGSIIYRKLRHRRLAILK